jgi:hypothetical protein
MSHGPFIRRDAARQVLLRCSELAILVPIAKGMTKKETRIFYLIVGDNPTSVLRIERARRIAKLG